MSDFWRVIEQNCNNDWMPFMLASLIGGLLAFKILFVNGKRYRNDNVRLDNKIAIVTGASSGIGLEVAQNLCKRGAHVILAVRNAEKGKRALVAVKAVSDSADATAKLLDVSDLNSVRDFANQINLEYGHIDILINNAGCVCNQYATTDDELELTMATNYFGPFLLTHLLLPLLQNSSTNDDGGNARIINVTACSRTRTKLDLNSLNPNEKDFTDPNRNVFKESKLALTLFSKHLADLLADSHVTVTAVNPGLVSGTEHTRHMQMRHCLAVRLVSEPWQWLVRRSAARAAQSVIYAACEPDLLRTSGAYIVDCDARGVHSDLVTDTDLQRALYYKTCEIVTIDGITSSSLTTD